MKAELLEAIRTTLREEGVLTEKRVGSRCPGLHRATVGRGIKQFRQFQERQEKMLRGNPIDGRPVPWELAALRESQTKP